MAALLLVRPSAANIDPRRLVTLGDSVLDCGHYNDRGIHPGQLVVHNDNLLFPKFAGRDLNSRGPASLNHCARDGATVDDLPLQARDLTAYPAVVLLTVGDNDLLRSLAADRGPGLLAFERALAAFLRTRPRLPVLMGSVYDPTFGDDRRNFLGVPADVARANHRRVIETTLTNLKPLVLKDDRRPEENGLETFKIVDAGSITKYSPVLRRAYLPAVERYWR